ncbi:hypothetical protein O9929_23055 [Vibrio lentus]|nr:hypothetical protein [Vibrio lentus]
MNDFFQYAEKVMRRFQPENGMAQCKVLQCVMKKNVIFLSRLTQRNGGVYGVGKGISEAISNISTLGSLMAWAQKYAKVRQSEKAIGFEPDAIVFGRYDAVRHKAILKKS